MTNYYEINAQKYASDTVDVDMAALRQRFLTHVPAGGRLIDAGCGSGRDSKVFHDLGYRVLPFDDSGEMCLLAEELIGIPVACGTFDQLECNFCVHGIWACASLLHVPRWQLPEILVNFRRNLRRRGVLYASFKYGTEERTDDEGRYFNDVTPETFRRVVEGVDGFAIEDVWVTDDQRPNFAGRWVNALLRNIG